MSDGDMLEAAWSKLSPEHRTAFAKWFAEHGRLLIADEGRGAEPAMPRRASDWTAETVRKADAAIARGQRVAGLFPAVPHHARMNGGKG